MSSGGHGQRGSPPVTLGTGVARAGVDEEQPMDGLLRPTYFLDFDHPHVARFAEETTRNASSARERAVALFYAVRDGIRYDPYGISASRAAYRASAVLDSKSAYCIPKAVLLAASARATGIPARLGFADVRNHLASEKLLARLGTDLFIYHGYVEMLLGGRWVKATPAFNVELCRRFGVRPLEFDGRHDALFHEYSVDGHRHMEYVAVRGAYEDLPYEEIMEAFAAQYGTAVLAASEREHDGLFDSGAARQT